MLLPLFGLMDFLGSFYLTIVMGFVVLNFLGIYYSIISEGSIVKNTARALAAGVFTIAILLLVAVLTGA
jgi:VIT1/CCC1 family predicted Fe2+/Mn2+ transporter